MNKTRVKQIVVTLLLTTAVFNIICIVSWKNDFPKDGSLHVGFPNAFYMQSSGDNPIGPVGPQVFYFALVIDILFAFLAAAAVYAIILRVRKATA